MKKVLLLIFLVVLGTNAYTQVELVPVEHRVYDFLRRMDAKGVIDFNSAVVPVSRRDVSDYLKTIKENGRNINNNDKSLLDDFEKEFEFELREKDFVSRDRNEMNEKEQKVFNPQIQIINTIYKKKDWVNDNKYIAKYIDSNVAVWGHLKGGLYQRNSVGDSLGARRFLAGDLGFEIRGTMYDRVGFAMSYSNGSVFTGNASDKIFAGIYDPYFRTATSLRTDGRYFDHLKGYIRYEIPKRWLSIMIGKENFKEGFGFIDNLFFSGVLPYPMIKLDLKYKEISYTFSYGNTVGDSAGENVENRMISTHRMDVRFAKWMRFGFYESVLTSNTAFSFVHLNPFSFITSADLNTGSQESYKSNTFMGFDIELKPVKNFVIQGTFLIDDFNLTSLNNNTREANDNKFGYQAGVLWNDAFTLNGLSGVAEYTRLDPFVYTHRYNKQQFTNWGFSMGHQLPPNSDEWAFKFDYNVLARLNVGVLLQFQRSGEGFTYDSLGKIDINYGGNINHGERFYDTIKNRFLQGDRVNRSIAGFGVRWEPVRQFVVEVKYFYMFQNLIYAARKGKEQIFYLNLFLKI